MIRSAAGRAHEQSDRMIAPDFAELRAAHPGHHLNARGSIPFSHSQRRAQPCQLAKAPKQCPWAGPRCRGGQHHGRLDRAIARSLDMARRPHGRDDQRLAVLVDLVEAAKRLRRVMGPDVRRVVWRRAQPRTLFTLPRPRRRAKRGPGAATSHRCVRAGRSPSARQREREGGSASDEVASRGGVNLSTEEAHPTPPPSLTLGVDPPPPGEGKARLLPR
jgi:hypothetical protein